MAKNLNVLKGGVNITINGGINVTVNGSDKVNDLDWKVNEIAKGLDRLAVGIEARCPLHSIDNKPPKVDPTKFSPDQIRSLWADFQGMEAALKEERRLVKALRMDLEGSSAQNQRLRDEVARLECIIGNARSALADA